MKFNYFYFLFVSYMNKFNSSNQKIKTIQKLGTEKPKHLKNIQTIHEQKQKQILKSNIKN